MDKKEFKQFLDLVLFDQSLLEYEDKLDSLYHQLTQCQESSKHIHQLYSAKSHELQVLKKDLKDAEFSLENSIAEEKKIHTSHADVHDKKEYAALKKETDYIHTIQQGLEKKILSLLTTIKIVEKDVVVLEQQFQEAHNATLLQQEEYKQKIVELENAFEDAKNQIPVLRQGIPKEWISHYDRIRYEAVNPLAYMIQDTCSACFYNLTPFEAMKSKDELLTCKGCYRFLYNKE